MRTVPTVAVLAFAALFSGDSVAERPVQPKDLKLVERLNQSKKCHVFNDGSGELECAFSLGNDFKVVLASVGKEGTGIIFERSSFVGDYYGAVGVMHGCIVVRPGEKLPLMK